MTMENDLEVVAWLVFRKTETGEPYSSSLRFNSHEGDGVESEPLVFQSDAAARIRALEAELARKTEALRHEAREHSAKAAWDFVRPKLVEMNREKGPAGVWSNGYRSGWDAAARSALEEKTDV